MPGSSLLSHGETPHYHRRYGVSLLSSASALSVSRAEDLPGVLEEAVSLIRTRRQSVLVDVQLAR
ncbi:hypothetical protein DD568_25870 [Klebsiella pneumoniae]|nr:hypothetical protein DD568_25870 [Klebsiella pneumoniae]